MAAMDQHQARPQEVVIMNTHGEKLAGLLHEGGSKELVIVCHGFICTKENEVTEGLTFALQRAGFSTFRFDFSGNGESGGEFGYANYPKEAEDLRAVIEHFRNKGRKTFTIVGYSKGADVVLLYAAKYHDIAFVGNVSGRFYMHEGIEVILGPNYMERIKEAGFIDFWHETTKKFYRATHASLTERLNIDMRVVCSSIDKNTRVETYHGHKDDVVELKDAKEFDRLIPNHRLHVIKGAKHGYRFHSRELYEAIVSSVKECHEKLSAPQG